MTYREVQMKVCYVKQLCVWLWHSTIM